MAARPEAVFALTPDLAACIAAATEGVQVDPDASIDGEVALSRIVLGRNGWRRLVISSCMIRSKILLQRAAHARESALVARQVWPHSGWVPFLAGPAARDALGWFLTLALHCAMMHQSLNQCIGGPQWIAASTRTSPALSSARSWTSP